MTQKGKITAIVLTSIGALLLISTIIWVVVKRRKEEDSQSDTSRVNTSKEVQGNTLIEKMQSYLLNLGMTHNNQVIIDSIRLTGGIDGIAGDGFETALAEAIDKGFISSLEDLENRVS